MQNFVQPGAGVDFGNTEKQDISQYVETEKEQSSKSVADTFLHIVPTNFFQSLAEGDLLAIIFFTVLFALGVSAIGERGKPVLAFFEGVSHAMFHVVNVVMKAAPFGVFALIGVTVSKFGLESLISLGKLVGLVYFCARSLPYRCIRNYRKDDWRQYFQISCLHERRNASCL
ncbi:hypothetical protein BsIDN1_18940 [Bacillus safensis]|uniref:Uncharacterized protein n=1 Tax=Bacillus safensis TaxID=561879 RepID=A0A5S9M9Q5_BACIA|nr:hypothetical protein BsIDN1_18940 [Bacillus safensis]